MECSWNSNIGLNTIRMLRREDFMRTMTSLQKVNTKYKKYRIGKKADRRKATRSSKKQYSSGAFDICRLGKAQKGSAVNVQLLGRKQD